MRKVIVLGLDCAPPDWLFESWLDSLPNLKKLAGTGICGRIRSCDPPITVPAWMCFSTGRNPGALGLFGFRNRRDFSYPPMRIATSYDVTVPTVWDLAGAAGRRCIVIGVPPSYPPKPVPNCEVVSCFLTPDTNSSFTYPPELAEEIRRTIGDYRVDVESFRTENRDLLLSDLYSMTEKRWDLAEHLIRSREWDLFFLMEIGTDRMHHGFWKFIDPSHRKYEPSSKYVNAIIEYYQFLDDRIGRLLGLVDDDVAVLIVSDHGAKRMDGALCLNEWLIQEKYLHVESKGGARGRLEKLDINWENTIAWGAGGYYGRIFLNLRGREARGSVDQRDRIRVLDELSHRIRQIPDDKGKAMETVILRSEEIYDGKFVRFAPDLLVYFDDLRWRCTETVGGGLIHSLETELGPDDAVHDYHGMFILKADVPAVGPHEKADGYLKRTASIVDGATTILSLLGLETLEEMEGQPIWTRVS